MRDNFVSLCCFLCLKCYKRFILEYTHNGYKCNLIATNIIFRCFDGDDFLLRAFSRCVRKQCYFEDERFKFPAPISINQ